MKVYSEQDKLLSNLSPAKLENAFILILRDRTHGIDCLTFVCYLSGMTGFLSSVSILITFLLTFCSFVFRRIWRMR